MTKHIVGFSGGLASAVVGANCIPCVKGKKAYWGLVYLYERAAWDRAVAAEKKFGSRFFTEGGTLEEELVDCLRLANKRLSDREKEPLYEFPCECAV